MWNKCGTTIFAVLAVLLQLGGCASVQGNENLQKPVIGVVATAGIIDQAETAALALWRGEQYLLSFNDKQQIEYRNLAKNTLPKLVSNSATDGNVKRIYLSVVANADDLHAAWMEKNTKPNASKERTGEKYINFTTFAKEATTFNQPQRISQGGGAFEPILKSNDSGDVYAIWPDERNGARYDMYINVSHDRGVTWKSQDIRLSDATHLFVIDPVLEVIGSQVVAQWAQVDEKESFKIVSRTSSDRGETWSDLHTVYKGADQPVSPQLVRVDSRLTACWAMNSGVACANSSDVGATWSAPKLVDGTARVGRVIAKADSKGRIHLVINQRSEDGRKAGIFYSQDNGDGQYSTAAPISRLPIFQAKAISPALAIGKNDAVFIASMDYTYLSPLINATFSLDGGRSWKAPYIPVSYSSSDEQYFPVANGDMDGGITLVHLNAGKTQNQFVAQKIDLQVPQISHDPKVDEAALKQRVTDYWQARVKGDWAASYEFMDPYYRRKVNKLGYINTQGRVKYYSHSIKSEPVISGIRAAISVAYESEVPEFMVEGKPLTVPRKETTTTQNWIWADGNWCLIFEDLMGHNQLPD